MQGDWRNSRLRFGFSGFAHQFSVFRPVPRGAQYA
jgi:hypothetical protein